MVFDRGSKTELTRLRGNLGETRVAHLTEGVVAFPEQIVAAEIGISRTRQHLPQQDRFELLRGFAQFAIGRFRRPFGQTALEPNSTITARQQENVVSRVGPGASLAEVVDALNALGASPADLVAILEGLKQAGSLTAELVII